MVSQKIYLLEGMIDELDNLVSSKFLKQEFKDRLENISIELDELKEEIKDYEED